MKFECPAEIADLLIVIARPEGTIHSALTSRSELPRFSGSSEFCVNLVRR